MKFTMYHTCITVLDLEKSMKFYEEALGLKEVRRIEAANGSSKIVPMITRRRWQSTDRWAAFASRIRGSVCTLSRTRTATGWRSYRRAKAMTIKRRSK